MSGNNYGDSYGYEDSNPYQQSYELSEQGDDFVGFLDKISAINNDLDNYNHLIELIEFNQKKLLNEVNLDQENTIRQQLDTYIAQATSLQQTLKKNIKQAQATTGPDSAKKAQAENSRQRFLSLIQEYRTVEASYREQTKEQAIRQYKIVQPQATDEEIEAAVDDVGGQQIFSQAIINATRRGEASTALNEVKARHRDLQKLEKTMAELVQLFEDMQELVAEQNVAVQNVDQSVQNAQKDLELGLGHTDKAVSKARSARKKKQWCYAILAIVIIIIIVIIVVPIATHFG